MDDREEALGAKDRGLVQCRADHHPCVEAVQSHALGGRPDEVLEELGPPRGLVLCQDDEGYERGQ